MIDDNYYMDICRQLAEAAGVNGNPPAGCVIVMNDKIVAKAEEASKSEADITCHAEIEAIREAVKNIGANLSQCTMYTTHEPCVMCAYPIRYHGIRKIVIQSPVQFFGGVNSEFALLTTLHVPAHWPAPPEIVWLDRPLAKPAQ